MESCFCKYQDRLNELEICAILKKCLRGLQYLHHKGQMHRDIKAANILLTEDGTSKLADFGVSTQLTKTIMKKKTFIGTPYWMAPEVILSEDSGDFYDLAADIWSIGITAIEMAHKKPPFYEFHPMKALFMIPKCDPPTLADGGDWSSSFRSFISSCLVREPSKRPTVDQLLAHPFFQQLSCVEAENLFIRRFLLKAKNQKCDYSPNLLVDSSDSACFTMCFSSSTKGSENLNKSANTFIIKDTIVRHESNSHPADQQLSFSVVSADIARKYYSGIIFGMSLFCFLTLLLLSDDYLICGNEFGLFAVNLQTNALTELCAYPINTIRSLGGGLISILLEDKYSYLGVMSLNYIASAKFKKNPKKRYHLKINRISTSKHCDSFYLEDGEQESIKIVCSLANSKVAIFLQHKKEKEKFIKVKEFCFEFDTMCYFYACRCLQPFLFVISHCTYKAIEIATANADHFVYNLKNSCPSKLFPATAYKNPFINCLQRYYMFDTSFAMSSGTPISVQILDDNNMLLIFSNCGLLLDCEKSECNKYFWSFRLMQSFRLNDRMILLVYSNQIEIFDIKSLVIRPLIGDPTDKEFYFLQNIPESQSLLIYEWDASCAVGCIKHIKYC